MPPKCEATCFTHLNGVPIAHAQKFGDAAKRAGVNIEQVIYTGVGHGFVDPAKQAEHFGRVERFLDNSLRQ